MKEMPKLKESKKAFFILVGILLISISFSQLNTFGSSAKWKCIDGDCKNGKGTATLDNGRKYEGEFKKGKPHGQGSLVLPSGTTIEGEFKKGDINGYAKLTRPDGLTYEGEFKNNKPHGKGVMILSDSTKIEGEFRNGTANGKATQILPNGNVITAIFINGVAEGQGSITRPDGTKIRGKFVKSSLTGECSITMFNGGTLSVNHELGIAQGSSNLISPDGSVKIAVNFKDGIAPELKIYSIRYTYPKQIVINYKPGHTLEIPLRSGQYLGHLNKNKDPHGYGVMDFSHHVLNIGRYKYKYEGWFQYGLFHGNGTIIKPDGTKVEVIFKEGEFVSEK